MTEYNENEFTTTDGVELVDQKIEVEEEESTDNCYGCHFLKRN